MSWSLGARTQQTRTAYYGMPDLFYWLGFWPVKSKGVYPVTGNPLGAFSWRQFPFDTIRVGNSNGCIARHLCSNRIEPESYRHALWQTIMNFENPPSFPTYHSLFQSSNSSSKCSFNLLNSFPNPFPHLQHLKSLFRYPSLPGHLRSSSSANGKSSNGTKKGVEKLL